MALPRLTLPPLYLTMLHIAVAIPFFTLPPLLSATQYRCLEIHYDTLPLRNLTNLCHRMTMSYHTLPCLRIVLLHLAPFRFAIATRCSELFYYAIAEPVKTLPPPNFAVVSLCDTKHHKTMLDRALAGRNPTLPLQDHA